MMTTMNPGSRDEPTPRTRSRTPNLTSTDPYTVLGLLRGASLHEIRRAYFELVREYPPEVHPDTFKIIRAAYEKLRQADVKAETDLFLFQPPSPWEPRKRRKKLDLDVHAEDIVMLLRRHGDLARSDYKADYRRIEL
jgi:curved DNA-binding protein CbpA